MVSVETLGNNRGRLQTELIHANHLNVMKSFTTSYFVTSVLKEFGKCYMGNFLRLDRPRDESCPSVELKGVTTK